MFGGAAAVTGVLAVNARNDFEEKQATFGVNKATLEDDRSKTQTFGIVTDALFVATALSAGLSVYMTVRYFGSKRQNTAKMGGVPAGITVLPMGIGYARSF